MVRMDLFRSEEMVLVQLIMPAESAHDTITYLAELSLLQFRDVSPETPKLFSMSPASLPHLLELFLLSSCTPSLFAHCFPCHKKLVDILNPHPSKTSLPLLLLLLLSAVILATRKRILAHRDPHSFVQTFKIQMFMVLFLSKPFAHNDGGGWSGHETVLVFWVLIQQLLSRCANWP
jgi:hypothetical protein